MPYARTPDRFHDRYVTTREMVNGYEHTARLAKQYAPSPHRPKIKPRPIMDIQADIGLARRNHLPTKHLLAELTNARHAALVSGK